MSSRQGADDRPPSPPAPRRPVPGELLPGEPPGRACVPGHRPRRRTLPDPLRDRGAKARTDRSTCHARPHRPRRRTGRRGPFHRSASIQQPPRGAMAARARRRRLPRLRGRRAATSRMYYSKAVSASNSGPYAIDVRFVPGHSPGSLAFGIDGALYAGDVLFRGSVGPHRSARGRLADAAGEHRRAARRVPAGDSGSLAGTGSPRRSARSTRPIRSSRSCADERSGARPGCDDRLAAAARRSCASS